ncbi:deaminase reductase [Actinoplanes sp. SE50]|uniref:dihydrofolate reductase family protein n=1 Tax=unclassified Actinoplanes TaxID=2626549 RepID=UPI00023ED20D|nr:MULTISPECIES: dihydrofolate reductase family protein [unclassified Actinoplanes]AEV83870.1 Riboflavin biosynthesis protein ribD [Actinoplanes sp. SE50/110]ATO81986.1 deaminase reductase [Actinoplanes sp. SE50]SLL99394.1 deaminase reductase [Actinoplanes sp. SE50/110]
MARLICTGITSLDGYIADERGNFDWSRPDEEVHSFVNDLERPIGTYLYGRRLYEVMRFWEDAEARPDSTPATVDYARVWRAADKVVYSTTLAEVTTARTRLERVFDPEVVRKAKEAADRDLSIGGPHLAAHAFRAGLVDEVQLFVSPIAVGGGTRFLPDGVRLDLKLAEQRRFANGVVYLRYRAS